MRNFLLSLMMLCSLIMSAQLTMHPSVTRNGGYTKWHMPTIQWTLIDKDGTLYVCFGTVISYVDRKIIREELRLRERKRMVCRYISLNDGKSKEIRANENIPEYVKRFDDNDNWVTRIFAFPSIESGVQRISIIDELTQEYWEGIHIKNALSPRSLEDIEQCLNDSIANSDSPYAGRYEAIESDEAFAFIQERGNNYKLVNISAVMPMVQCASVKATAYPNVFVGTYYMANNKEVRTTISFKEGIMSIMIGNNELQYIRMNDGIASNVAAENIGKWSGSGFALKDGYVVTNYHVAGEAQSIEIFGVKGIFSKGYKATIVGVDKVSDLALLKISDKDFSGYGNPPYAFKSSMVDVGENVYVLGYPLTQTMGEEVKLTNGIVSSRSGYEGNVTTYQISVPVQPGNSGGPMFDMKGNLVGIVCAKHADAENANYAIKTSYLKNLVESVASSAILPAISTINGKELKEQVKQTKNFVYLIKCSNTSGESLSSSSGKFTSSVTTINSPTVRSTYEEDLRIKSVIIEHDYTAITLEYSPSQNGNRSFNVATNTYIVVNGTEYVMTRAEGIKTAPDRSVFSPKMTCTLYFPPIPASTPSLDLIDKHSRLQFYGIKLK